MRDGSTSTHSATPPHMVIESGCAPPMPPSPPVSTMRPSSDELNSLRAHAAKVSYVPCRIPCVPMYIQLPAVIWPYIASPFPSSSQKCSHVAHFGTSSELAMSTRGAPGCEGNTATGLPRLHDQRLVVA